MTTDYTLKVRRFQPGDPRLGRHVVHDSRSLRYLVRAADPATLKSVRHHINIGIMDQGDLGSCTGHAGTNALASDPFWPASKDAIGPGDPHAYALHLYADATAMDPWPGQYTPDDTGSDGLSIAKVLQTRGLISGYQHATSLEATLTALADRVVIVGTSWLNGMYDPDSTGKLTVSGATAGGHEYALDELDVERQRVWMRNSWSDTWGVQGRAWMSWDDLGKLLADDGDCTVLVPKTEPAPQPAPVPAPAPTPAPGRSKEDATLAAALTRFMRTSSAGPSYLRTAGAAWLKAFPKGVKR